ncbi:MAG: DUF1190 domain-containing protein [Beijerinckiaceae bacterium]
MRAIPFVLIGGVAAFMATMAFRGECPGGVVVTSEENCRATGGVSAGLCSTVYSRAVDVARNSGSVYQDEAKCSQQYGSCLPHGRVLGSFVPVPAGFCVQSSGDLLTEMTPVYRLFVTQGR